MLPPYFGEFAKYNCLSALTITIPSHNKIRKTKQNQRENIQTEQAKTHSKKQTEKGKSDWQTSCITTVVCKCDILASALVLVWQVKQRQN